MGFGPARRVPGRLCARTFWVLTLTTGSSLRAPWSWQLGTGTAAPWVGPGPA